MSSPPQLIGYFPKRKVRADGLLPGAPSPSLPGAPVVEELCSVSDCVAPGPDGWRERQIHNVHELFDTRKLAWSVVPRRERPEFEMFAYRLYPVQFIDGRRKAWVPIWDLAVEPLPRSFVRLGWDAVVGGDGHGLGCSPLSCNYQAGLPGIPAVNRHCLMPSERQGLQLARLFSKTKPEPGPYCVVEVWREPPAPARKGKQAARRTSAKSRP